MISDEVQSLESRRVALEEDLTVCCWPPDPRDDANIFLEVRAAPAATKPLSSPATCSGCTPGTPRFAAGGSR